jgi:hypothetical protein
MSIPKDTRPQTVADRARYVVIGIIGTFTALGYWWYQHQPTQAIIGALQPSSSSSTVATPLITSAQVPQQPSGPTLIPQSERQPLYQNSLGMTFLPLYRYADGKTVWLAVHETRIQDYAAYIQRSTHSMQGNLSTAWEEIGKSMAIASGQRKNNSDGSDHPVSYVHAEDALAFCNWLTTEERQHLHPEERYRLPTEQEWTAAASDPTAKATLFPWGDTYPPEWDVGNLGYSIDGYAATSPVKQFPPNKLGYYDLCGNVREICLATGKGYVYCGSNWSTDDRESMLISHRTLSQGQERSMGTGFRCVLERQDSSPAER